MSLESLILMGTNFLYYWQIYCACLQLEELSIMFVFIFEDVIDLNLYTGKFCPLIGVFFLLFFRVRAYITLIFLVLFIYFNVV